MNNKLIRAQQAVNVYKYALTEGKDVELFRCKGTNDELYFIYKPKSKYCAWVTSGSDGKEWIDNLGAWKKTSKLYTLPGTELKYHYNFYDTWLDMSSTIESKYDIMSKCIYVDVLGHSRGSALASLIALQLKASLNIKYVKLTTTGGTRFCNKAAAKHFGEHVTDYLKIEHIADPVPHILGSWMNYAPVPCSEYLRLGKWWQRPLRWSPTAVYYHKYYHNDMLELKG